MKNFIKKGLQKFFIFCIIFSIVNTSSNPFPDTLNEAPGVLEVQAATVYKKFYFQGGLFMPPKTTVSFSWTYMKKGDVVQFVVQGNNTLNVGIYRKDTETRYGATRSGNFAVSMKVPASGYYRVFISNPTTRNAMLRGGALCSRQKIN